MSFNSVSKDTKRDTKGSNDTFPASFLQRIKSRFSISAGVVEAPPPYARDTASPRSDLVTTSLARIKAVNEYGQILGYVAHNFTDGGYNLQPLDKAVEVDLPVQGKRARAKDALLQIGFQTPLEEAHDFPLLGICLNISPIAKEYWELIETDEEKTGAIYKNRSNIRRADDLIGVGKPASSRVWSLHTIEDGYEELRLNWRDKTGDMIDLKATSSKEPWKARNGYPLWQRRSASVLSDGEQAIRLIVDRC